MPPELPKLLASLRRACKAGVWSSGVNLVRAGAVTVESRNDEEIVLRVRAQGRAVPAQVVLYPGEDEWDCDCPGRLRPCDHLAAAAIALAQTEGDGASDPKPLQESAEVWARVAYRFAQVEGGMTLRRFIVRADGSEAPLVGTLSALLSRPSEARAMQVEQWDLQADRLLELSARAILPPSKLDALIRVLVGCRLVFLDGRQVAMSEEEVLPHAVVTDRDEGVSIVIRRDSRVTAVPSAGVVVVADEIARHGELDLCGGFLQNLPIVRVFGPAQLGEVAARILPDLCRRMLVEVRSTRLPRIVRGIQPRMVIELSQVGSSLAALPTLVYGNPPCARIDDGRLVHLTGPVPVRDESGERRLAEKLRSDLDLVCGRRTSFEGADTARFVDKLKRWRGELAGDGAKLVGAQVRLDANLRVHSAGSATSGLPSGLPNVRFDFDFTVTAENKNESIGTVSATAVLSAWREGLGLVPLDGGGFAPLPEAWLAKHGQELASLLAARANDGRLATHALPTLGRFCEDLDQPPPPGLDRLAPLAQTFERLPEAKLPQDLAATLRPYQRIGVNWLAFLRSVGLGGILADDMGLGKTIEAMCVFEKKILVVCPTSVLPNWRAEISRFRPSVRVSAYHGPARKLDDGADVTLTTYAILRLDSEDLSRRHFDIAILDEAQAIKNPDSQVARAAFALDAEFRLAMTGTPVENRLDELWSLMHFANRGLLGGRRDFDVEVARPISDGIPGTAESLRQRIRPFVLRRRKAEVAPELPPRSEATLRIDLDERERGIYDAVRAATQSDLVAALGASGAEKLNVMKALEALLRLRQAACHPGLLPGQKAATSSKVEALVEALVNAAEDGHKALVFSQWTSFLDLIEPALVQIGVEFTRLDGSTRDRAAVVDTFQAEGGPPVMLISLKAGGTGLNLTAADHVFICDPWWNPAVEDQAADRAHRIGQERPVMIYRLVAANTVEERILELQQRKRAIGEAALGDAATAASLTREDLLALLA
jgi:superfamily II DNA or RNA helicase